MGDINHFSTIVQILERPRLNNSRYATPTVEFRAQLPQTRKKTFATLVCWGKLGEKFLELYGPKDYVIIEGYVSLKKSGASNSSIKKLQSIEITVLKTYPFLLSRAKTK